MQQSLATSSNIMHELKETQVPRQFLLRDATMRPQPRTQERPEALYRIDMDLMETVSILTAGVLAGCMIDTLALIAPFRQAFIDVVLVGVDQIARRNDAGHHRLDGCLLDVRQHADHDLTIALEHPQDEWFFICQRPPSAQKAQINLKPHRVLPRRNYTIEPPSNNPSKELLRSNSPAKLSYLCRISSDV